MSSDFGESIYTPWPASGGSNSPAGLYSNNTWQLPAKFYLASRLTSTTTSDELSEEGTAHPVDDRVYSVDGDVSVDDPTIVTRTELNSEALEFIPSSVLSTAGMLNADAPEFFPGSISYEDKKSGIGLDPEAPEFVPECSAVDDDDTSVNSLIADLASLWVQGLQPAFHVDDREALSDDKSVPIEEGSLALLLAEIASDSRQADEL